MKRTVVLNYDHLSPVEFCHLLQQVIGDAQKTFGDRDMVLPIIAVGHVKEMKDIDNVHRTLDLLTRRFQSSCLYWTMTDAVVYCLSNRRLFGK